MSDCVFCGIIQEPSPVYFRDRGAVAVVPLNPVTAGHLLILPRTHIERLDEDAGFDAWTEAGPLLIRMVRQLDAPGFNIIQSNGKTATQTIAHVHFHIVPRREGDGLPLPWDRSDTDE